MYYLMVLIAVLGVAGQFSITKLYQSRTVKGDQSFWLTLQRSLSFSLVSGAVAVVFFLCIGGFRMSFSPYSLLIGALVAFLSAVMGVLAICVMSMGRIALYTLSTMLGGMMIPFLFGVFLWQERISVWRVVGLGLLIVSLLIPMMEKNREGLRHKPIFYLLCAAVFLCNGAISVLSKLHQVSTIAVDTNSYLILANASTVVVAALALCYIGLRGRWTSKEEGAGARKNGFINTGIIVAFSLVNGTSYMLQLLSASHLDASLLYPMITGGTVICTTLFGALFFKERISRYLWWGVGLTLVATLLFLL